MKYLLSFFALFSALFAGEKEIRSSFLELEPAVIYEALEKGTVRTNADHDVINIYAKCPHRLYYKNKTLISEKHDQFYAFVEKEGLQDNYQVNHLLVQLFFACENEKEETKLLYTDIHWDKEKNELSLDESLPFADFVSRDYKEGEVSSLGLQAWEVVPGKCCDLEFHHSEHVFMNLVRNIPGIWKSAFRRQGLLGKWTIKKIGLILYSSFDSCEKCEAGLLQFFDRKGSYFQKIVQELNENEVCVERNAPFIVAYFSVFPCKQSSYYQYGENEVVPFGYNKIEQKFFFFDQPEQEASFYCNVERVDVGKISRNILISTLKDYPKKEEGRISSKSSSKSSSMSKASR